LPVRKYFFTLKAGEHSTGIEVTMVYTSNDLQQIFSFDLIKNLDFYPESYEKSYPDSENIILDPTHCLIVAVMTAPASSTTTAATTAAATTSSSLLSLLAVTLLHSGIAGRFPFFSLFGPIFPLKNEYAIKYHCEKNQQVCILLFSLQMGTEGM